MLQSLPSWERGLKSLEILDAEQIEVVAPLVGAWIEIMMAGMEVLEQGGSLPSWERGLKYNKRE